MTAFSRRLIPGMMSDADSSLMSRCVFGIFTEGFL